MHLRTFVSAVLLAFGFALPQLALAQSATSSTPTAAPAWCLIGSNLARGSSGASVSALQDFLSSEGYFSGNAIGVFGPRTFRAVVAFQGANGVRATGFVGPATRAALMRRCPPRADVTIYSITPTSGPVGTQVSIDGFGFTDDNTIHFGYGAIVHVPVSSSIAIACTTDPNCHGGIHQTLTFAVPEWLNPNCYYSMPRCLPPSMKTSTGEYAVSVTNDNGTSNSATFTVTDTPVAGSLSISGLDAPSRLYVGASGTWSVHVVEGGSNQNLHYSVHWGDEVAQTGMAAQAPQEVPLQTSGTFTHAYGASGSYTPVFTVSDDAGRSATASASVTVVPLY